MTRIRYDNRQTNHGKRESVTEKAFVYILRCGDGTYYTGWTNDLTARVNTHQQGKGAKYTKSRLPVALIYYEELDGKVEAMRREWVIKRLSRQ